MPIEFQCTHCSRQVRVPDGSEGKKCKCPECQNILTVPEIEVEAIEIKLEVPCPRCNFVLVCDPSLEGTRGLCPNCKFIFTIAPPGSTTALEAETSLQLTFAFQCPHCRQLFEGKPGMEGRKGKCIHCKEVFEIKRYVDPSSVVITKKPTDDMSISFAPNPRAVDTTQPKPVMPSANPFKTTPAKAHPKAAAVHQAVAPVEKDDWLSSVPAPVSSADSQPLTPYASLPSATAYSAPSSIEVSSDAVSVRNYHLSHESAIKGFGLLYAIGAGFYFLIASLAVVFAIAVFATGNSNGVPIAVAALIYAAVYFTVGGLVALVSSGFYKLSDVGKIGGSIFSVLGLCAFPIGTAIAAYTLYLIFSEKGIVVFSPRYREIVRQTPHIRAYIPIFVWVLLGLGALSVVFVGLLLLSSFLKAL
jgi:hypothetical protein